MRPWELFEQLRGVSALDERFTRSEIDRLVALRERGQVAHLCSEFDLDQRRLRYVRWLVDHGRIGEGEEHEGGRRERGAA